MKDGGVERGGCDDEGGIDRGREWVVGIVVVLVKRERERERKILKNSTGGW